MKNIPLLFFVCSRLAVAGQAGSEIYLFDMKVANGQVIISNGTNITNHKGYDNQPFFHPSQPVIYYSSFNDSGRSDIKYYNFEKKETKNLTTTHDREYSPTVTPDGKFISCILQRDNGAQDLVKYPIQGGKPQLMIWHLKIGYHLWTGAEKLLLFVLDDSIHNSLHYYNLGKSADTVIAENIGRGLQKIPGENSISFIQKIPGKISIIKRFNIDNGVISNITPTLNNQDYFIWLPGTMLLTSDGTGLYTAFDKLDTSWQPITIEGSTTMLKGITRLAVSADNTKLAVVVSE